MIAGFDVAEHRCGAVTVLAVRGELDMSSAPRLRARLVGLLDAGAVEVIIDLAHLDFIDSTGLHVLMSEIKRFRANGGDLALRGATRRAMKVFEVTGLGDVFRFVHRVDSPAPVLPDAATA